MKITQTKSHGLIGLILGVIATLMIFLPALVLKDSETSFTGLEIAFGKEFASLGSWASGEIAFNPFVLLAFALPVISGLVMLQMKKGYIIASILFVISAILMFMMPQLTTVTVTLLGNTNEIDVEWTYGIGLILSASLSILGAIFSMGMSYKKM